MRPASRLRCGLGQLLCSLNSLFVCSFCFSLPSASKKSYRPQSACLAFCVWRTLPLAKRFYPGKSRNPTACLRLGAAASRSQHPRGLGAVSSTPSYCSLTPPERSLGLHGSWQGSRSSCSVFAICFGQALVPFPGRWQHPSPGPPQGGRTGEGSLCFSPARLAVQRLLILLVAAHKSVDDTDVHIWLYCKGNRGFVRKGLNSSRYLAESRDCQ